jgi:hypothetical protein
MRTLVVWWKAEAKRVVVQVMCSAVVLGWAGALWMVAARVVEGTSDV